MTAVADKSPVMAPHGSAVESGGVWRRAFASVSEYVAHVTAEQRPGIPGNVEARRAVSARGTDRGESWLGVASCEQVRAAVAEGWQDGIARVAALAEKVTDIPTPRDVRRRPLRGASGSEFDCHAALRGEFDRAWTYRARVNTVAVRRVRLVAQIIDNAGTSASELFWRGAAVIQLAEILSASGYAVQIDAAFAVEMSFESPGARIKKMLDVITVKPLGAPLDLPNVASVICLAGFARIYGFAGIVLAGAEANRGRMVSQWLGSALSLDGVLEAPRGTFITPRLNSAKSARDWIKAVLIDIQGGE